MKLLIELFYRFWISLFRIVFIGHLTFDIVLVELHKTRDIRLIVFHLNDLLDILSKLEDDCFLFFCFLFLLGDLNLDLDNFRLMLSQTLTVVGYL